jgi:hypothetical protein
MAKKNKVDRLSRWLTLGANIGVVLGLIILIVEVRQNAALSRTELQVERNRMLIEIEISIASPETAAAWVKSIRAPEEMTDVEIRIAEAHLVAVLLQWDQMFRMQDGGLVSAEEAKQHILNSAQYYFGSTFAKNWWYRQSGGWDGTPMMEVAGPIIEALDENFLAKGLDVSRIIKSPITPSQRDAP